MEVKLTPKQELFIENYLANGYNGTQAYLQAYPDSSYDAARSSAPDLLAKPNIKSLIEKGKEATIKRVQITKEELVQDLIDIKNSSKNDPKQKHNAIKSVEVISKMLGLNEPDRVEATIKHIVWNEEKTYDDNPKRE
jgi:phage terminase small subunit